MKILHYIPNYAPAWSFGGPVRSVSELCEELARRRHDVTVFTTDAGLREEDIPHRRDLVMRNGVKVHYYPRTKGYGIKSLELEQAVADRISEFDLLHVSAVWHRTGPAACRAAYTARVPYIISPRGALGSYSWQRGTIKKLGYYYLIERLNLKRASGFHYTSQMEAVESARFGFGRPCCVVANGIDFKKWRYDHATGQNWRAKLKLAPGELLLLYAGRLHHKKGLDFLPAVLGQLNDVPWRMVFVGDDEDGTEQRLRNQFVSVGLIDRVRFVGGLPVTELVAAYSGADIFLLPSLHENFGNVAVEAAACGCWVLASDQTGVAKELADLQVADCLPREADAWRAAVRRNQGRVAKLSRMDHGVMAKFSRECTAGKMEQFYHSIVTAGASGKGADGII